MAKSKIVVVGVAVCVIALLLPFASSADTYASGATVVYKQLDVPTQEPVVVDDGVMVCHPSKGIGVGGGCLPFNNNPLVDTFIEVKDFAQALADPSSGGHNIAFQVCVDVNGDNKCISGGDSLPQPCDDIILFSHDDAGWFANPLGPLAKGWPQGCPQNNTGKNWIGYIVFLCEGVHTSGHEPEHVHPATTGTITKVPTGNMPGASGNFCGGLKDQVIKDYLVA